MSVGKLWDPTTGQWLPALTQVTRAEFNAVKNVETRHYIGTVGEPAFINGWSNYDNTGRNCCFWKDRGICYLSGIIKGTTNATAAFTLPVGYRAVNSGASGTSMIASCANGVAGVSFGDNGSMVISALTPAGAAAITWTFLDGIHFPCA